MFVRDNPNSWTFVMIFVTDILLFLVVVVQGLGPPKHSTFCTVFTHIL